MSPQSHSGKAADSRSKGFGFDSGTGHIRGKDLGQGVDWFNEQMNRSLQNSEA